MRVESPCDAARGNGASQVCEFELHHLRAMVTKATLPIRSLKQKNNGVTRVQVVQCVPIVQDAKAIGNRFERLERFGTALASGFVRAVAPSAVRLAHHVLSPPKEAPPRWNIRVFFHHFRIILFTNARMKPTPYPISWTNMAMTLKNPIFKLRFRIAASMKINAV
jgi:hypothetical protein